MKPSRVSVPESDAITASSFLQQNYHESLPVPTHMAGGSKVCFPEGDRVGPQSGDIIHKNGLIGPIGMYFSQSHFLAIKAGCNNNINTICCYFSSGVDQDDVVWHVTAMPYVKMTLIATGLSLS